MEFRDFLLKKHILINGEREIKEISATQYVNRLKSLRENKLYNEEEHINPSIEKDIQEHYKDWKTYLKTLDHYINYKKYSGSINK